ncbi:MAG: DUF4352 domain-containing protein [Myxococcota bacterium]
MGWFDRKVDEIKAAAGAVPSPTLHPLGSAVRGAKHQVRAERFDPYVLVGTRKPAEGKALYAALVEVVNASAEPGVYFSMDQWMVFDASGFVFRACSDSGLQRQPALGSGHLSPGSNVRGWVTFELPVEIAPARLHFDQYTGSVDFQLPAEPAG